MPREMTALELARLSREGRARYEDDGKPVPPPRKEPSEVATMCQAIIAGMEKLGAQLAQSNQQQAVSLMAQVRDIAAAAQRLAAMERREKDEPQYEFTVTERDNLGRAKKMIAKPIKGT